MINSIKIQLSTQKLDLSPQLRLDWGCVTTLGYDLIHKVLYEVWLYQPQNWVRYSMNKYVVGKFRFITLYCVTVDSPIY